MMRSERVSSGIARIALDGLYRGLTTSQATPIDARTMSTTSRTKKTATYQRLTRPERSIAGR